MQPYLNYLLISSDLIVDRGGSVTPVRIFDTFRLPVDGKPYQASFYVSARFYLNETGRRDINMEIRIYKPDGELLARAPINGKSLKLEDAITVFNKFEAVKFDTAGKYPIKFYVEGEEIIFPGFLRVANQA